jgi:hypothetical protein
MNKCLKVDSCVSWPEHNFLYLSEKNCVLRFLVHIRLADLKLFLAISQEGF